jgi:hypothetical protein
LRLGTVRVPSLAPCPSPGRVGGLDEDRRDEGAAGAVAHPNNRLTFREQGLGPNHDPVRAWVEAWIHDLTLRMEFDRGVLGPDSWVFPDDLRDAVYAVLVKSWGEAFPPDRPGYLVDYAEDDEGMALLHDAIETLHSLFHEAAHRSVPGLDNPLAVRGELRHRRNVRTHAILDREDKRPS